MDVYDFAEINMPHADKWLHPYDKIPSHLISYLATSVDIYKHIPMWLILYMIYIFPDIAYDMYGLTGHFSAFVPGLASGAGGTSYQNTLNTSKSVFMLEHLNV